MFRRKLLFCTFLIVIGSGLSPLMAQSPRSRRLGPPPPLLPKPTRPHAYAGVDFVSMYISRGQVYSSKASMQPWAQLYLPLTLHFPHQPFNEIGLFVTNWNSFQAGGPGVGQSRDLEPESLANWYEADFDAGVRLSLVDHLTTSLQFNYYTSPSNSFKAIQELDWRVHYHNPEMWKPLFGAADFTLNPRLRVAKETRDLGGREKFYIEPSLAPTFKIPSLSSDITWTVPLVIGLGADGQYYNARGQSVPFGFFETGLNASIPLDLLPQDTGSMTLNAGVSFIFAGNKTLTFWHSRFLPVGHITLNYSF